MGTTIIFIMQMRKPRLFRVICPRSNNFQRQSEAPNRLFPECGPWTTCTDLASQEERSEVWSHFSILESERTPWSTGHHDSGPWWRQWLSVPDSWLLSPLSTSAFISGTITKCLFPPLTCSLMDTGNTSAPFTVVSTDTSRTFKNEPQTWSYNSKCVRMQMLVFSQAASYMGNSK